MRPAAILSGRVFGLTMLSGFAGLAGIIALLALSLGNEYQDANQHAEIEVENISRLLEEHVLETVHKTDLLLREVQRNVRPDDMRAVRGSSRSRFQELHELMKSQLENVPEVAVLHITDAAGNHIYSSVDPVPRVNIADRYHFTRHRDTAAAGLVVSPPLVSRTTGKWTVVLTRRLNFEDGSFAGIVNVILDLDYFQQFYRTLNLGRRGVVALYDKDLHLAARYPPSEKDMGKRSSLVAGTFLEKGTTHATYHAKSSLDGIERLFSFRRAGDLPLIVVAGMAEDDYLADWHRHIWQYGVGAVVFSLVGVGFGLRQRRAEAALRLSDERFRTIADYTYDWEYWEGPGHEILFMSPSCVRVTGYTQAEFLADPDLLYRIIHPDDLHLMVGHQRDAAHEDEGGADFRIVRRDGEIRWIAHGCRSVFGRDGKFMGRRASNRDITERKQAEETILDLNAELEQRVVQRTAQLEAANKELEEFSYSMSHDMRAPLRAIDGFSRLLQDEHSGQLDDEGRRLLTVVRDNARHMGRLIDDILRFLRMGRRKIEYGAIDVALLAREAMAELQAAAPQRRLRLEIGELPPAWGDREMIKQVVLNLLSNAVKFSPADAEAVIEVAGEVGEGENVYQVKDRGVGFDMQYANKLFRVFERVHPTGQYEGTGIGLAIVKRIVDRHGGRVWAEGKVGEGATFHFSLPRG